MPRGRPGTKAPRKMSSTGYVLIYSPEHPRADLQGYVPEHILVVELVLGRRLPPKAVVHHANEARADNRRGNLVACDSHGYHMLLHARMRARAATGNPNAVRCWRCGEWGEASEMKVSRRTHHGTVHRACFNEWYRAWRAKRVAAGWKRPRGKPGP